MLVPHIPFHEYKMQHASTVTAFDNVGSMRWCVYEASSGADGGGMASERWESMRQARCCGKLDVACRGPREECNLASYSVRAIGVLSRKFAANRMQCIIRKATVFVAVSCFEYIFIIIYLYILLCIILYIPITYFYNYILFSCFKYFVCFHHNWDIVACFHHIYSFSKIFVAIKI